MNLHVKKADICILFYVIYFLLVYEFLNLTDDLYYSEWLLSINILIGINLFLQLYIAKYLKIKIISIIGMLILFTYMFHLSHAFLHIIDYDFPDLSYGIGLYVYGENIYRQATNYSFLGIIAVFLGTLFAHRIYTSKKMQIMGRNSFEQTDHGRYLLISLILLAIALPLDVYFLFAQIVSMTLGGYAAVHEVDANNVLRLITYLVSPACYLLMVSYKDKQKIAFRILMFFICYKMLSMLTGIRSYAIINIVIMLYLYHKTIRKFDHMQAMLSVVVGYIVLAMFIVIRNVRHAGLSFENVYQQLQLGNINPIYGTMEEFGGTINVVCETISRVGNSAGIDFAYGGQVFFSFLSIIPFVSYIFSDINFEDYNLTLKLDIWNLGGSYIADSYFDFGEYGLVALAVYGFLVCLLIMFVERKMLQQHYYVVAMFMPTLVDILFSVRSTSAKIPRVLIWIPVFMILAKKILVKKG